MLKGKNRTRTALGAAPQPLVGEIHPMDVVRFGGTASASNNTAGVLYEDMSGPDQIGSCVILLTLEKTMMGSASVPIRLESNGARSKTSTPSFAPNTCSRSRPVDWFSSVGTSPGFAPSPTNTGRGASERRIAVVESARVAREAVGLSAERVAKAAGRNTAANIARVVNDLFYFEGRERHERNALSAMMCVTGRDLS